ncbi:MAG: ImmA/IrrE family metallo-endopeptidase [Candidatus Magasanikbacteria bacterium]|nr:ImmA/IrrE family metallo-endopeptidase [Candidatus Magasanikbacteria bacterium]
MKELTIEKTKEILDSFGIKKAPVPVEYIVAQYGINISYAPSKEYSGVLIRKSDGGVLMGVNSDERQSRIRFTIAHELAHFIFDTDQTVTVDYRNKTSLTDKPQKEKRADLFAANFLMPEEFLVEDFKREVKDALYVNGESLKKLAEQYQVSKEAMMYRLKNLNLVPTVKEEIPF